MRSKLQIVKTKRRATRNPKVATKTYKILIWLNNSKNT